MRALGPLPPSRLEKLLGRRPAGVNPDPLPIGHVGSIDDLPAIVASGRLEAPTDCDVFKARLVYLSYGGLFYHPPGIRVPKGRSLTAFLFAPKRLKEMSFYLPVDSGAMKKGLFSSDGASVPAEFMLEHYIVTGDGTPDPPRRLVKLIYDTNHGYRRGKLVLDGSGEDPLPLLHSHLTFENPNADHRQRTIECLLEGALELDDDLLWVAAPEEQVSAMQTLLKKLAPHKPGLLPYESHDFVCPAKMLGILDHEARKFASQYFDYSTSGAFRASLGS